MATIFHIAYRQHWDEAKARGVYAQSTRGRTLEDEGFIHCCAKPAQVDVVANSYYAGERDVLVLLIDEGLVQPRVQHDEVAGYDTPLPHIYGPLNVEAVISVVPLEVNTAGQFHFEPDTSSG